MIGQSPALQAESPIPSLFGCWSRTGASDAYNIEIVGSDIDTRILAEASVGIYGERAFGGCRPIWSDDTSSPWVIGSNSSRIFAEFG